MSLYSDMSTEDLTIEVADLRSRIINAGKSSAAGVRSVAGEGRRVEYFAGGGGGSNVSDLRRLLSEAETELNKRNGIVGRAIGVIY